MSSWDAPSMKTQFRLTRQRLGQLQLQKESEGQITRSDIATLLQQGNIVLARARAHKLIQEDAAGDLLEVLQVYIGIILEHFEDLERSTRSPSPSAVEAAASIMFAAPHTESNDLNLVRDMLAQLLGSDFAKSAAGNSDSYVSPRVIRALSLPSAAQLNQFLYDIAKRHGVSWTPDLTRPDIVKPLSEILDPANAPVVDLPQLQRLCSNGLPDSPAWLRPRIWKLLSGVLPVRKAAWDPEIRKQRESYYDLIRRLLKPVSSQPSPSTPLSTPDRALLKLSKQLSSTPQSLFAGLQGEPASRTICPLDLSASDDIRIDCAHNLDLRLQLIEARESQGSGANGTPTIRVDPDLDASSAFEGQHASGGTFSGRSPKAPQLLLPSWARDMGGAHQKHASALLRLLYVHSCLNPANRSPHLPSLLVPLYCVAVQEVEPHDLAHAEADAFWLFEAMVGEIAELEEEDGGNLWRKRLSERLAWADEALHVNLSAKGLDPALPHFSYRWMAPLLTQTLPLPSVLIAWDALFSCPTRTRDGNPKLEYLLDICTSMLIRARPALFRLGKSSLKSPSLWLHDTAVPPPSPMRAWELNDAFTEGMSLLQRYPVDAVGGMDMILQTASDLSRRRWEEWRARKSGSQSLGARLKETMWKGFTNQVSSDGEGSDEDDSRDDGGDTTETPAAEAGHGITSRLASVVLTGFKSVSSAKAPSSPMAARSPLTTPITAINQQPATPEPSPSPEVSPSPTGSSSFWSIAGKLKESDTVANLSKASTNWRAKAMLSAWGVRAASSKPQPASPRIPPSSPEPRRGDSLSAPRNVKPEDPRRGSLPAMGSGADYSPPARPVYFAPPRDSTPPHSRRVSLNSPPPPQPDSPSTSSEGGFLNKTKQLQASLVSLTSLQGSPTEKPKSGPRPLLLNSSSLLSATSTSPAPIARPGTNAYGLHQGQWTDVIRMKEDNRRRQSQSSVSSLSPSDALGRRNSGRSVNRSDCDSDTGSRIVPLGRRSVSPMAPTFRSARNRHTAVPDSETNSENGRSGSPSLMQTTKGSRGRARGNESLDLSRQTGVETPESPMVASPPIPSTPVVNLHDSEVRVNDADTQRGSVILSDLNEPPLETPAQPRKRRKTPPPSRAQVNDTSDSAMETVSLTRSRTKRYLQRPASLRFRDSALPAVIAEQPVSPPANSLGVELSEEHDAATTPKAVQFQEEGQRVGSGATTLTRSLRRTHKISGEGQSGGRSRKVSGEGQGVRSRKISAEVQPVRRRQRDSAAVEGDDEGYDELLSAYESEEGQKSFLFAQSASDEGYLAQ